MPASNILALDIGEKRVGVALARSQVRVPVALETLERQAVDFWELLQKLLKDHEIDEIVLGLPRGLEGQETAQTKYVQDFAKELANHSSLPVHWQDEALTSVQSENILSKSGKSYEKADIDAVAASLILSDYLQSPESSTVASKSAEP